MDRKQAIESRAELAKTFVHQTTASMYVARTAACILSRWCGCCNLSTATRRAGRRLGLIGESANPCLLISLLLLRVVCPAWIFLRKVCYGAPFLGLQVCTEAGKDAVRSLALNVRESARISRVTETGEPQLVDIHE